MQNALISSSQTTVESWQTLFVQGNMLQFTNAEIDENALNTLSKFLANNTRLKYLEFNSCRFKDNISTRTSLGRIACLPHIHELSLSSCGYNPSLSQEASEKLRIV